MTKPYRLTYTAYWIDKGILGLNGMIGCFAMTELAHGSNVAGLETTATFDEETDEFVIHTPHLGATKWWIGGAASTATHAAVFAQMIIKGKKHGVKTFVTQLRDIKWAPTVNTDTHEAWPRVR
jgi:acyl-CoA oxidase